MFSRIVIIIFSLFTSALVLVYLIALAEKLFNPHFKHISYSELLIGGIISLLFVLINWSIIRKHWSPQG